jgi:tRNA pseudouridine13 synthase
VTEEASDENEFQSRREQDITRWGVVMGAPCPARRLLSSEPLGGRIKTKEDDFLVEEIPLYRPCGFGEHLYLWVRKKGLAHSDLLEALRNHYRVRESAIGAAGMKDRIAVTTQTVSIHLPGVEPPDRPFKHKHIEVLGVERHNNKLRRGHLIGNRFVIRIRDLEPSQATVVWRGLQELEKRGVPNYYGPQRFGYRQNTHRLGALLLQGDYEGLLSEVLGAKGSWFPPHQKERREAFDAGHLDKALQAWGRRDIAERVMLSKMIKGASPEESTRAVSRHMRTFWASAVQSAIFNHTLERRLEAGTIDRVSVGDVAYRHQSRNSFLIDEGTWGAEDQQARVDAFEISPSGPIFGTGFVGAEGDVGKIEAETIDASGVSEESFNTSELGLQGTRRPFRVPVTNCLLESGIDETGEFIRVAFDLPRGAYATVVLREILGDAAVDTQHVNRQSS